MMVVGCDVMWALPEHNTTTESPYDVIEQLRAGSQEYKDWFKCYQWGTTLYHFRGTKSLRVSCALANYVKET